MIENDEFFDDQDEMEESIDENLEFDESTSETLTQPKGEDDNPLSEEDKPQRKRPYISHLPSAVRDDGTFIPGIGEKVVIEKVSQLIKGISHWLDTSLYTVLSMDSSTGNLKLWNEDCGGFLKINYMRALEAGYSFRIPPKKGPFIKRRTRSREDFPEAGGRINVVREEAPKASIAPVIIAQPDAPRKRGRPKGVKNRPKDVIALEKSERKAIRAERKRVVR